MEDLLSIITCFAAKLYGKRSQQFKKKIEQVLADEGVTLHSAMEEPSNVGSDKNHQGEDRKS
jgi:hypothetical protein